MSFGVLGNSNNGSFMLLFSSLFSLQIGHNASWALARSGSPAVLQEHQVTCVSGIQASFVAAGWIWLPACSLCSPGSLQAQTEPRLLPKLPAHATLGFLMDQTSEAGRQAGERIHHVPLTLQALHSGGSHLKSIVPLILLGKLSHQKTSWTVQI